MVQPPLDHLFALEQFGIKFGLDNILAIVEALDHPERHYVSAHIAGTNGKGSVAAMVGTVLRAAGHRVGRYTSPHLVRLNERFVVDGVQADTARLEAAAARVLDVVDALLSDGRLRAQPTFFEVTTAMAFLLFRESQVRVAVFEVGLGGRLDATNVVTPTVAAITTIGHDHMQYLGATLPEVAAEKAGIIKPGVPVVVGSIPPDAAAVIARIADEQQAPIVSSVVGCTVVDDGPTPAGGRRMRLRTPLHDYGTLDLALAGAHQVANAVVAVRILETLDAAGIPVPVDAFRRGLSVVTWPGRLDRRRLSDGREVLFDAAHNPEGAQALAAFLASEPGGPPALVFTAMRDKDVTDMLRALMPQVRALVLTRALTPRSADPTDLARVARSLGIPTEVLVEPSIAEALDAAWGITRRIVVAGSIFLLGDVMKHLGWS